MNVIKEIEQINKAELANGSVNTPASWHTKYASSAWVYVGNLPSTLSEGDIIAVMSQWGEVDDINLVRDEKDTGKSRGFCFLKYEDSRSCVLAVDNLNGSKILGRSTRVDHVENYRLPKHLREKEDEKETSSSQRDKSSHCSKPGHAYESKALANLFDIHQGHDLFAAPKPFVAKSISDCARDGMNEEEYRRAKRIRKEVRDGKRRDKAVKKEIREERRRQKRASKLIRGGGGGRQPKREERRRQKRARKLIRKN